MNKEELLHKIIYYYIPLVKRGIGIIWNFIQNRYEAHKYAGKEQVIETLIVPTEIASTPKDDVALKYEDAVKLMQELQINHEDQKRIGSCVAQTLVNLAKFNAKNETGHIPPLSVIDIYLDRQTLDLCFDCGMYPDKALNRTTKKGYLPDMLPYPANENELKQIQRDDKVFEKYRIKGLIKDYGYIGYNFEQIWAYITDEFSKGNIVAFQFSITSYRGWWTGGEFPVKDGENLGGHSVVGVGIPFILNGKRGFFVIDSAYSKGKVWSVGRGIRHAMEDTLDFFLRSARYVTFNTGTKPNKFERLGYVTIRYGEEGENVALLQEYLEQEGFFNYDGKKGNFREITRKALSEWQKQYLKKDYGGRYWGKMSQAMFKALQLRER